MCYGRLFHIQGLTILSHYVPVTVIGSAHKRSNFSFHARIFLINFDSKHFELYCIVINGFFFRKQILIGMKNKNITYISFFREKWRWDAQTILSPEISEICTCWISSILNSNTISYHFCWISIMIASWINPCISK